MMSTLFAVFLIRGLHSGSKEMGWLLSAQAVGGFLGSLAGSRVAGRFRPVALASACMILFGPGDLSIVNYPRWGTPLWPVLVLFFLIGIPGMLGYVAILTLFQIHALDRLRGRMFAVLAVSQAVAGMLGALVAGALGQRVSVVNLLTARGADDGTDNHEVRQRPQVLDDCPGRSAVPPYRANVRPGRPRTGDTTNRLDGW
jgi:predicted MFS family arabinose efflux permease